MAILLRTHKMLWGRAASRCSLESCRRVLVEDKTETDDESLVGEACHIVAESADGPRGESDLSPAQRDKYDNLILLCAVHHKLIDDQPATFTVVKLKNIKRTHEEWVTKALSIDVGKQRDEELVASYIDEWSARVDLDNWRKWTSWLLSTDPHLPKTQLEELQQLGYWLLSRIWPSTDFGLQKSLLNFRFVLQDFTIVFGRYLIEREDEVWIERFYKARPVEQEVYNMLVKRFEDHVDLVHDLVLELTRAANYVCDQVRNEMMPSFRLKEGVLLVDTGLDSELKINTLRTEYKADQRTEIPYRGLNDFMAARIDRDFSFGGRGDDQ